MTTPQDPFLRLAGDEMERIVAPIVEVLTAGDIKSCPHTLQLGTVAFVCGQHPQVGLQCLDCIEAHQAQHEPDETLTCDRCGTPVATIHALSVTAPGGTIASGRNSDHRIKAVHITELGVCPPCSGDITTPGGKP